MLEKQSFSDKETSFLGKKFSKSLKPKDIVILEGALGAGKTTFVKGILKGLGYRAKVLSPSFTLVRQYKTKHFLVYHIDLYRLEKKDTFNLGLDEFLFSENSIALIEWGDKIKEDLVGYLRVEFLFLDENKRKLVFSSQGYRGEEKKTEFIRN
jgi:tRNA threonylcarbamoyladenosine biosynthesis protein TsaE